MKKFFCALLVIVLLLTSSVALAASVPQPALDARESTVYIKVDVGNGYSTGSGFAVGTEAPVEYIVTNYHVIDEMVGACTVSFGKYTVANATVAVSLPDRDLAILKLDEPISIAPLPLYSGEPSALAGEQVYALGFPGVADNLFERSNSVRDDVTMTDGIISAVKPSYSFGTGERTVTGLQINVALNHGNSGGPLVNGEGIVVGVNTIGSVEDSNLNGAVCISELLSTLDAKGIPYLASASPEASAAAQNPWLMPAAIAAAVCAAVVILLVVRRRKKTRGRFASLNAYLAENNGKMGYDMTVYTLSPLFTQLKKAHENGKCLLSIYPENIRFYPEAGRAMLIPPKKQALCMGYSAPEQYKEIPQTGPWTDVYQLGALFYRMLTGSRLADVMTRAEDDAETARNIEALALAPAKKEALLRAVSLNRSERFLDIGAFLEALEIKTAEAIDLKSFSVQKKARKKLTKKAKGFIAAAVCAASLFCVLFSYWTVNRNAQNEAIHLLNQQNFTEAERLLDSIPDFIEPSIPQLKKLAHAGVLYESGDYETALTAFEALGDYSFAPQMIEKIYQKFDSDYREQIAELEEILSFQGLEAAYEQLGGLDFSRMSESLKQEYYKTAANYYEAGEIENSVLLFILLEDYKDSSSRSISIAAEFARKWIDDYNYVRAYGVLAPLADNDEISKLMNELMPLVNERGWLTGNDGHIDFDKGHWEGRTWIPD